MIINDKTSELIGAIFGDGNIYDKKSTYVELCGDKDNDKEYFKNTLIPIIKTQLNYDPKLFVRSGGIRLRINNKGFIGFLNNLGISSGISKRKSKIPTEISSNDKNAKAFLRGIFDTDGCIFYDKRKIYKKPYIRICLHMNNKNFILQVADLLNQIGIKAFVTRNDTNIDIIGEKAVGIFIANVGFSNPKHLNRIKSSYEHASVAQLAEQRDNRSTAS